MEWIYVQDKDLQTTDVPEFLGDRICKTRYTDHHLRSVLQFMGCKPWKASELSSKSKQKV
jgi:hypothetical protein